MLSSHRFIARLVVRVLLLLNLSSILIACGSTLPVELATRVPDTAVNTADASPTLVAPTVAVSLPPTASVETPAAEVQTAIQHTLDLYAQAYNEHNQELLDQAVDQENAAFRRFMQSRFEFSRSVAQGGEERHYTLQAILKSLPHAFVLARIARADGQVSDVPFRNSGERWVMSEPTEAQIGPRQQIEGERFTFVSYPWSADINPKIVDLMEQARNNVQQQLGTLPDEQAVVTIKPIFGLGSPVAADMLASYIRGSRDLRIEVFAPGSYPFGFYDPALGWEEALEATLTHEYTHLAMDRSFIPLGRVSGWMSEGLAEYVSGVQHQDTLREIVRSGQIIPIIDTAAPALQKQDLQHFEMLDADPEQTYALAYALVAYIVERYGGLDGFWKLARAYDKTQDLDAALQQAFGSTYEQFDAGWRSWLKATYT
jgi:hypothetical protein